MHNKKIYISVAFIDLKYPYETEWKQNTIFDTIAMSKIDKISFIVRNWKINRVALVTDVLIVHNSAYINPSQHGFSKGTSYYHSMIQFQQVFINNYADEFLIFNNCND